MVLSEGTRSAGSVGTVGRSVDPGARAPECGRGVRSAREVLTRSLSLVVVSSGTGFSRSSAKKQRSVSIRVIDDHSVDHLGIDRQTRMTCQGPGSRGPGDQIQPAWTRHSSPSTVSSFGPIAPETDPDRGVVGILVVLRHLVAGKSRATACTVGLNLVVLDQQPLIPELTQCPPDRLDIAVGIGEVGAVQIDPETDPLGHLAPLRS